VKRAAQVIDLAQVRADRLIAEGAAIFDRTSPNELRALTAFYRWIFRSASVRELNAFARRRLRRRRA
jgi:hypothetical protein